MRANDLERLYDYSCCANQKLLAALVPLAPAQFTQRVAGSYESIRNTVVHILSAEWGWLDRCGGPPRGERLKAETYPTLESVTDAGKPVERDMRGFLSSLKDEDLTRAIEFALGGGPIYAIPLGELMLHTTVHAAHHRGQVALLLRMLGSTPGDFDLLWYALDKPTAA